MYSSFALIFPVVCLAQTKVISMDGRPAGDQYLPSYLSISSWYSPSKCHLQIQNPGAPLQVNTAPLPGVNSAAGRFTLLHMEPLTDLLTSGSGSALPLPLGRSC